MNWTNSKDPYYIIRVNFWCCTFQMKRSFYWRQCYYESPLLIWNSKKCKWPFRYFKIRENTYIHYGFGLKINFLKSRAYGIEVSDVEVATLANTFKCSFDNLLFMYLDLPTGKNINHFESYVPIADNFHNKLSGWRFRLRSFV